MDLRRAKEISAGLSILLYGFFCVVFYPHTAHIWENIARAENHEYAAECFATAEIGGLVSFVLTIMIVGFALLDGFAWMIIAIFSVVAYIKNGEEFFKVLKRYNQKSPSSAG